MKLSRCGTCYDEKTVGKRNGIFTCRSCIRCPEVLWLAARAEVIRIEQSAKNEQPIKCAKITKGIWN